MHVNLVFVFFIVFSVRDGTETKYPSIVFLSIHSTRQSKHKVLILITYSCVKVQSKKDDKDQESIPHLSQDTQWESNKITKNITNKSQALSLRVTTRQQ